MSESTLRFSGLHEVVHDDAGEVCVIRATDGGTRISFTDGVILTFDQLVEIGRGTAEFNRRTLIAQPSDAPNE